MSLMLVSKKPRWAKHVRAAIKMLSLLAIPVAYFLLLIRVFYSRKPVV
jgi:hypothetical protein